MHRFCSFRAPTALILTTLLLCGARLLQPCRAAAEPPAPNIEAARRTLAERGLAAVGHRWLSAEDARLCGQLDSLDRLQRQVHQAEKQVDERIAEKEQQRRQLTALVQTLDALNRQWAATSDAAKKKQMGEEIARAAAQQAAIKSHLGTPEQFAEEAGVRQAVIEWINARNALAMIVVSYADLLARVQAKYAALGNDADVQRALETLGERDALGSGRNFATYRHRLDDIARNVLNGSLPLYRQNGRWRTSVLLSDARPAACTLVEGSAPSLLPEGVVRAAGITIPATAPQEWYNSGDGRWLSVRRMRVSQLRLGGHVVHDVEFLLLPPEGEDLGTQLNYAALPGLSVKLDPQHLRLQLDRKPNTAAPDTGNSGQPNVPITPPKR